jgi:hypothetical protein
MGRWGTVYVGNPIQEIPQSECVPTLAGNDPALFAAATEAPLQISPRPTDFSLVVAGSGLTSRVPLFPECQSFIESCRQLVVEAEAISQTVHGSAPLTAPPF